MNIMKPIQLQADVGVIVARFQTPDLHDGHRNLIDYALSRHDRVIVLLGSTPGISVTRRNPLDYFTRELMIREAYPQVTVVPLADEPTDLGWSRTLDSKVREITDKSVLLYGSRDSFIPYYKGEFQTVELEPSHNMSGTEARREASKEVRQESGFRKGVTYAAFNRHPVSYQTVDIACIRQNEVLLARKGKDPAGQWRFPGGFLDPTVDTTLESAAAREFREECGRIETANWRYLGSRAVDDWRYRREVDQVMTALFRCDYFFGAATAADDVEEVKWFDLTELSDTDMVAEHRPLLEMLVTS